MFVLIWWSWPIFKVAGICRDSYILLCFECELTRHLGFACGFNQVCACWCFSSARWSARTQDWDSALQAGRAPVVLTLSGPVTRWVTVVFFLTGEENSNQFLTGMSTQLGQPVHTFTHSLKHTRIHTHTANYIHTLENTYTHTLEHMDSHTHTHTQHTTKTCIYTHTQPTTITHLETHTHTHTYPSTHQHIWTHIHPTTTTHLNIHPHESTHSPTYLFKHTEPPSPTFEHLHPHMNIHSYPHT